MSSVLHSPIVCQWIPNLGISTLSQKWIELEKRANSNANFFISWLWIGTWLEQFVTEYSVILATRDGEVVGLGIIVSFNQSGRFGGVKYYLHRLGNQVNDKIWIEHNDFLIADDDKAAVRHAMLESISSRLRHCDALIIGASESALFSGHDFPQLSDRPVWQETSYCLNANLLTNKTDWISEVMSKSARYQIRRSLKKYRDRGTVRCERAATYEQAISYLNLAKPLHIRRWGSASSGSGFVHAEFTHFHETLIKKGIESGNIELNLVSVADDVIAVIYNFRYGKTIYFYLSAINYDDTDPHLKPGLVSHYLLIEQALAENIEAYDFLGGSARYKSTFSNVETKMAITQIEPKSLCLSIVNTLRSLKQRYKHNGLY